MVWKQSKNIYGKVAEIKILTRLLECKVNKKIFQNWSHRPGTTYIIIMDKKRV